jgi:hypothetical protein
VRTVIAPLQREVERQLGRLTASVRRSPDGTSGGSRWSRIWAPASSGADGHTRSPELNAYELASRRPESLIDTRRTKGGST